MTDPTGLWFCWSPGCGWSGPLHRTLRKPSKIGHVRLCPKCFGTAHPEDVTERAAIKEYDGGMTREDAERE